MKHRPFFFALLATVLMLTVYAEVSASYQNIDPLVNTYQYTESKTAIQNPERGFLSNHWVDLAPEPFNKGAPTLHEIRHKLGQSLVRTYVNLRPFIDGGDITPQLLEKLQIHFNEVQKNHLKAILIFNYSPHGDRHKDEFGSHASTKTILKHIQQVMPVIHKNKHFISIVQLGFIGRFGEWNDKENTQEIITGKNKHESLSYDDNKPYRKQKRQQITQYLIDQLPAGMLAQIRYTGAKREMFSGSLTASTAFSNSYQARIGFHNDCFLTDNNDYGTFNYKQALKPQINYLSNETKWLPMGGETCHIDKRFPDRASCKTALEDLKKYHYSFLRLDFNVDVIDVFRREGCFETIANKMGYRFVLRSATLPKKILAKKPAKLEIVIENIGWAAPYNKRPITIVARLAGQEPLLIPIDEDVRRWLPGKRSLKVSLTFPETAPKGDYTLSLWMPDAALQLRHSPERSIRFANENVWNNATGENLLGSFSLQ